ncbi:acyl-CoA N-acyltransferase [Byssothecium circinans]|uniref:Acyl-CoA N-acyltransferase n=1 Tax=Byssothecium circinans TaxID=147558 RepID=A0A6A5UGA0_9PLEO|nr:acyl-CoA N-acyltransferase [Byssothecium circinans]
MSSKMPADPNLKVSLLEPNDIDTAAYTRIRHEAFRDDVNQIFYSKAPNCEPSHATLEKFAASIKDGILNKGITFTKCVDTSTGQIIAGARWTYHKPKDSTAKERTWDEVNEELIAPEPYAETNIDVWNGLFDLFYPNKREIMGTKPYFSLDTLVTHKDHYRRGAGGLLLTDGLRRADEAGVEAYLESSPMGRPLYERFGFVPIKDVSLDLKRWDGHKELTWTLMKRPVQASSDS